MDDFNTVYALLVLVMLFVLLSRLDNRFGKVERELNEIKKRMDDYLKLQQKAATEEHKPKEEIVVKETEDVPLISQMTEHVTVIKAAQQGKVVPENKNRLLKQYVRHWERHKKRRLKQNWKKFVLRLFEKNLLNLRLFRLSRLLRLFQDKRSK